MQSCGLRLPESGLEGREEVRTEAMPNPSNGELVLLKTCNPTVSFYYLCLCGPICRMTAQARML